MNTTKKVWIVKTETVVEAASCKEAMALAIAAKGYVTVKDARPAK